MSSDPSQDGVRGTLATIGIVVLPVLCCGLPLLIASGALGGLGAVLGNPWVIGAAVALAVGTVAVLARRSGGPARSGDSACCPPDHPTHDGIHHRPTRQEF